MLLQYAGLKTLSASEQQLTPAHLEIACPELVEGSERAIRLLSTHISCRNAFHGITIIAK
ncbi:hypothetical protein EBZ39_16900 [bacterium]|nr:hypothetical protein [bacterium]